MDHAGCSLSRATPAHAVSVPTAPEVARTLADALEGAQIPYAVGGALALAVWGFPRATNDVDLDVFAELEDLPRVFDAFERAGCVVELDVERMLAFGRGAFDRRYVRQWLVDLVGQDDERVLRWDRLVSDVDSV